MTTTPTSAPPKPQLGDRCYLTGSTIYYYTADGQAPNHEIETMDRGTLHCNAMADRHAEPCAACPNAANLTRAELAKPADKLTDAERIAAAYPGQPKAAAAAKAALDSILARTCICGPGIELCGKCLEPTDQMRWAIQDFAARKTDLGQDLYLMAAAAVGHDAPADVLNREGTEWASLATSGITHG
ncbi:MAG: hypothetical protein F4Y61_08105 [Rhodothermaceae bacterium]|nr:hypothetical protein [Rhodothermaceae bacterium]